MKKKQIKILKAMMEEWRNTQMQDNKQNKGGQILAYLGACLDGIKDKE